MIYFASLSIIVLLSSCNNSEAPNSSESSRSIADDTSGQIPMNYTNTEITASSHNCDISGEVLDDNQYWLKERNTLVCIKADSLTYDKDLNVLSHRILELYDTETCQKIAEEVLPLNVSADFPYYLAKISYNIQSQLIAIRGFNTVHIYDIASKKLFPPLEPQFKEERFASDAQSGRIIRVELWEDYLIGYAQEYGAFAFSLDENTNSTPALPFAEWMPPEEIYYSLFLLPSQQGGQQAFIPSYDFEKDAFSINPIFSRPQEINTENATGRENSQFVVFRGKGNNGSAIAVDLMKRAIVDLPQNIGQGNNQTILAWLNQNK